jgi:hypothetical protein
MRGKVVVAAIVFSHGPRTLDLISHDPSDQKHGLSPISTRLPREEGLNFQREETDARQKGGGDEYHTWFGDD